MSTPIITSVSLPIKESATSTTTSQEASSFVCHEHQCPCANLMEKLNPNVINVDSFKELPISSFRDMNRFLLRVRDNSPITKISTESTRCNYLVKFVISNRDASEFPNLSTLFRLQPQGSVSEEVYELHAAGVEAKKELFFFSPENRKMTITIYKKMRSSHAELLLDLVFGSPRISDALGYTNSTRWSKKWLNYYKREIKTSGYRQVYLKITEEITRFQTFGGNLTPNSFYNDYLLPPVQKQTKREFYENTSGYKDRDDNFDKEHGLIVKYSSDSNIVNNSSLVFISQSPGPYIIDSDHCNKIIVSCSLENFYNNYHAIMFLLNKIGDA